MENLQLNEVCETTAKKDSEGTTLFTITGLKPEFANEKVIIIPNGATYVAYGAFRNCMAEVIVLPSGLKSIDEYAFTYCRNLKKVYVPDTVSTVKRNAFNSCPLLEIYCQGAPTDGWAKPKPNDVDVYAAMEAFNFHRSGGSFEDDPSRFSNAEDGYNPDDRPVHVNVERSEFLKSLN